MLSLLRQTPQLDRLVRAGRWNDARRLIGGDIEGSLLGLVGFGNIGRLVAARALGLGMRVLAYDPFQTAEAIASAGVEPVAALDDLLGRADVVSLHMTATAQTRHLFNAERIGRMKAGAFLVNTARAALVDQDALIDALRQHKLGGAALDVVDPEPIEPTSPFLQLDNVIITPHHAGTTVRTRERTLKQASANLVQMLKGELPAVGLCNPGVRARARTEKAAAF